MFGHFAYVANVDVSKINHIGFIRYIQRILQLYITVLCYLFYEYIEIHSFKQRNTFIS